MSPLGILSSISAGILLAVVINIARTLWMISPRNPRVIRLGPWSARLTDGGPHMTLHQKAVVALTGLWAMPGHEAVYFTALHDSEGRRLRAGEDYVITGRPLPAEWWSVTAYCNYQFIPNSRNRYSRSSTNLHFQPDGSWCIHVSAEPSGPNWISAGRARRGLITFSLRMYLPEAIVFETPAALQLPVIHRLSEFRTAADSMPTDPT